MQKKLPIGIENFEEFSTEGFYYVDKTLLIKELLNHWGKVNLFTRPRRFGKSLNMSMLKCFFEINHHPERFDGLKIMQEKELCDQYMGKFPVISISLKNVDGLSYEGASLALRNVIGDEAMRFQFLLDSKNLSRPDKEAYRRLIKVGKDTQGVYDMTEEVAVAGMKTLSRLLYQHYKQKVILLIDEYDVPLDKAFQYGYYDQMMTLIRLVLSQALKTNDCLYFAVLSGCLRISKESIFTGLNNLKVDTISDFRYNECFGFTDHDVDEILAYYHLSSYKAAFQSWYDGYRFGNVSVYCPWDVINYCDELLANPMATPKNYWANTSGNVLIMRLLSQADQTTKEEVEALLNGECIIKHISQELVYRDIDESIENIWSTLYSTGYLTGRPVHQEDDDAYQLWIPNQEIVKLLSELVDRWFSHMVRQDSSRINRFCQAFLSGDVKTIQEMLNDYLWDSISVRDRAVRDRMKENIYHGLLLGLLRSQGNWMVKSNVEMGEGYGDLMVFTRDGVGLVIELKYAHDGEMETACQNALKQIADKKYDAELKRRGMTQTINYGIAFYEKNCMVMKG